MKLEHFALNVEDPIAMSKWYVANLGLTIVRQQEKSPFMTFLADSSGWMMIEIYKNPAVEVPPYRSMNPLLVHIAFVSENPDDDKSRLLTASATIESEQRLEDGSHLIMLRDPWGICIQLCKRGTPMLLEKEIYKLK